MNENEFHMSVFDKIHRRSGHIAASYLEKRCVLVWGGFMGRTQEDINIPSVSEYHATDEIWAYDSFLELWEIKFTGGTIPPRYSGSCGIVLDHYLYVFGGYCWDPHPDSIEGNSNRLYRLNLINWTWELLVPQGGQPVPCDKLVGWTHGGKLYYFGGFGPVPDFHTNFTHVADPSTVGPGSTRGWNNQLVAYNPADNRWEWPETRGPVPSPRAAHAADLTGDHLYLFGGRFLNIRKDDLHCLDMTTMTWSGNLTRSDRPGPEGRSWHTFTFTSSDRAVLHGGLSRWDRVLGDCWLLDLHTFCWIPYSHSRCSPRLWHTASLLLGEVMIVGGFKDNVLSLTTRQDHAVDIIMLCFTPKSLLRLCLDTVLSEEGKPLQSQWNVLPHHLQAILKLRKK